jgi:F-type H+-transporting ATPase subunit c
MLGLAALGAALGQSRAIQGAVESIGRNPAASSKVFVPMLLGLSFIETVLIFCWILGFQLIDEL